jgi:putative transposase
MATYVLTATTCQRRGFFSRPANAELLLQLLFRYRDEGRYLLHGFAILRDEVHLLLTPSRERTSERCAQCIKEGFSAKVCMRIPGDVWQPGFQEHRVREENDFRIQIEKIAALPEQRNLRDHPFVHTRYLDRMDAMPDSSLDQRPGPATLAHI